MKKVFRLRCDVTKNLIKKGVQSSSRFCAINLAVRKYLNHSVKKEILTIGIGTTTGSIRLIDIINNKRFLFIYNINLSKKCQTFIKKFDEKKKSVKPDIFLLVANLTKKEEISNKEYGDLLKTNQLTKKI